MSTAYWCCRKTESCTSCGRCLCLRTRNQRLRPGGSAWKYSIWCSSSRFWVLVWCWVPLACYWSTELGVGQPASCGRGPERKERQLSEIVVLPRPVVMCKIDFYTHVTQRRDENVRIYKYSLSWPHDGSVPESKLVPGQNVGYIIQLVRCD
jgi:hypothetical protein